MIHAGRALRTLSDAPTCMEDAAQTVVDFFHDGFHTQDGASNCVLARCFKTHPLKDLPASLRECAAALSHGSVPAPATQCLTLLATRGELPEWNSRFRSAGHQAIPLPTVAMVMQAPMILQLVLQLGLTPEDVIHADAAKQESTFDVFHVPEARGSLMVPQQTDFVERYGVASVLGFGGLLAAGELFAVILFTRVPISTETAALFRTLALSVKLHLLPFSGKRVFAETPPGAGSSEP